MTGAFGYPQDGLEVVRVLTVQWIGHHRVAAIYAITQHITFYSAGVFSHDRPALGVIGIGGKPHTVFVGDAGQCIRQIGIAGIGLLVVMVGASFAVGVNH